MAIRTFTRGAAIASLAAALSFAAVTSSQARWGGHWGPGAAIGIGAAGLALGAAAAANAAPYGYDGYDGYYDYAPGPVVVAPGPGYYDAAPDYWSSPYRRRATATSIFAAAKFRC
jgi:hypothetical protein